MGRLTGNTAHMIARIALISCLLMSLARAGPTRLEVQRGWGNQERSGRWNPLFVTASDPQPRNVVLEIVTAHEGSFSMVVRERIAIGPNPQTFELFIPSHYSPWGQNVVVLRDADSGKRLAQFPPDVGEGPPSFAPQGPQGIVVGVTGQRALLQNLESGMKSASVRTAYVPVRMLPRSAIGYDSVDVLFLNQAELGQIDADQQAAIVSWVRGGGNVLVAPGAAPVPDSGPLLAALPARIGAVGMVNLGPVALKSADLPPRFARMSGRSLEPVDDAKPLPLLYGAATAYRRRVGLGQILLCPIDLGGLQFNTDESAGKFWRPILQQMVTLPDPAQRENPTNYYYGYQPETPDQQQEAGAINTLCDFVGDVPGAGRFGFSYVAVALIAMMIVVGPVDWFVLRRLGQQPWTWVTTAGWVGLITVGAIFVGYLFKSGDLYYRTVRVVEQVDDQTVATTDLAGIYSPRTQEYDITPTPYVPGDPAGWWQPAVPGGGEVYYNRSPKTDITFHQSDTANTPEPMLVNVWNVRFLRSEAHVSAGPVIEASLSLQPSTGRGLRLVGTIKNLSPQALKDLHVRTQFGVVDLPLPGAVLAPQQSVKVNVLSSGADFPQNQDRRYQNYGAYGSRTYDTPVNEPTLWAVAPDLSGRRSTRITALLTGNSDFACVYAQFVDPPPAATLAGDAKRIEQHYQWLRAVVAMKK